MSAIRLFFKILSGAVWFVVARSLIRCAIIQLYSQNTARSPVKV